MTTTTCPISGQFAVSNPRPASPSPTNPIPAGAWRYACQRRSRAAFLTAVALSGVLHAGLFLGIGIKQQPAPQPVTRPVLEISLVIPEVKELEPEPETFSNEMSNTSPELSIAVPMQADLPQLPRPSDFIQKIDFSSLLERPDLSEAKIMSIPDTARRGTRIVENIGSIFNLADLDRAPEPVFQPAPAYPNMMKRDTYSATVVVEFVVTAEGRVTNAFASDSTHPGFNDAATTGVMKWKFRPGQKAGRKVNTRMRVPIVFNYEPRS
jgi:protein TonB